MSDTALLTAIVQSSHNHTNLIPKCPMHIKRGYNSQIASIPTIYYYKYNLTTFFFFTVNNNKVKWEYQFAKTRISMPLHELLETDSRQAIPNLSIKLTARKACCLLFSLAKYYLNLPAINQLI